MPGQAHSLEWKSDEDQYTTCDDFFKIFDEDMNGLYQLSFLLTGDHSKAERCFVSGIEDCAGEGHVFKEWARAWARRIIAKNAIRELTPRRKYSSSFSSPTVFSSNQKSSSPRGQFHVEAILGLGDFERFVFVLCVLEHYREYECALLLGSSASEVRLACTQAIAELASTSQVSPVVRKM
jgi:hypothetical protein